MRSIAAVGIVGLGLIGAACGDSAKQPTPKVGVVNAAAAATESGAEPARQLVPALLDLLLALGGLDKLGCGVHSPSSRACPVERFGSRAAAFDPIGEQR